MNDNIFQVKVCSVCKQDHLGANDDGFVYCFNCETDVQVETVSVEFPHCDTCQDNVAIDCHDCEQHQQRISELCAHGTRGELSAAEDAELQALVAVSAQPARSSGPFGDRKRGERAAIGLVPPFHPNGKDHKEYRS